MNVERSFYTSFKWNQTYCQLSFQRCHTFDTAADHSSKILNSRGFQPWEVTEARSRHSRRRLPDILDGSRYFLPVRSSTSWGAFKDQTGCQINFSLKLWTSTGCINKENKIGKDIWNLQKSIFLQVCLHLKSTL